MQNGSQNQNKSPETSSIKNKNRTESLSSNFQQNQTQVLSMVDQNLIPTTFAQNKSYSIKNDLHYISGQKFSTSSCSTSKKSNQLNMRDSSLQNEKLSSTKTQSQMIAISSEQKQQIKYNNNNQLQKIKNKDEEEIDNIKISLYGRRIFIGKKSLSVGQQGKQQMVAFLGLFLPIMLFILYEIQYVQGLRTYCIGESWIICVLITSLLCFILFIYSSISNPGFIAVPLTKKQRHALPIVQQKGKKDFDLRYCYTCHIYRPLRTHHCKICDLCVIERDHHCPFLNNCIGYNNRKGYVFFLIFAVLIELLIITESLYQVINPFIVDQDFVETIQRISVILAIIQCIYSAILAANILSLVIFQFQLIARNRTTDEFRRLIIPDPKLIDIELNQEFDYGCFRNFSNVLFCSQNQESIYSNFDVLSRDYLVHRYLYYKKKDEQILHEDDDEEIQNNFKVKKNINNDNHLYNNQYKIQNRQNQNIPKSLQQKNLPFKQDFTNQAKPIFFQNSAQKENTFSNLHSNFALNQYSNSHIMDKEQSPTARSAAGVIINSMKNNYNQTYLNSNVNQSSPTKFIQTFQQNSNHQPSLLIDFQKAFSTPNGLNSQIKDQQIFEHSQKNQDDQLENINLRQKKLKNMIQNQKVQQQESFNNINNINMKELELQILKLSEENSQQKTYESSSSQLKTIMASQPSTSQLEFISSSKPFKDSDKREQQIQSSKQSTVSRQSSNEQIIANQFSRFNNLNPLSRQTTQDFDSNLIIYDFKPLDNNSSQYQNVKQNGFSTSIINKSQYHPTKFSENNSQQKAFQKSNSITSGNIASKIGQQKKFSLNNGISKLDFLSINLNNISSHEDEDDEQNTSYIEQKPNDTNGIKTLNINNFSSPQNLNGIKMNHSQTMYQQQTNATDIVSSIQNTKYDHFQKSLPNNPNSILKTNEGYKNANGNNLDISKDLKIDSVNQNIDKEKSSPKINLESQIQQDDFNYPQYEAIQNNKQNQYGEGSKRTRKLFQNVSKHSSIIQSRNNHNNSLISTDIYPNDNSNQNNQSHYLNEEQNGNYNEISRKKFLINNQLYQKSILNQANNKYL